MPAELLVVEGVRMIRVLVAAALVAAVPSVDPPEDSLSRWKSNMARHQQVLMHGVPAPYTAVRDPTPDNEAKLHRGAAIFDRQCSSCHGWSGRGTGPEGFFLVPAPADLAWLSQTPRDKAEPYIYWTVAEGGQAFESEMPAFKHSLSEEDIWSVAAYLRAGMPYASP
jgi:mono/diheme cytochrome c family protein